MPFPDLKNDIVLLDGALGTMLQKNGLQPGEKPEMWNLTHPKVLQNIHRQYVNAGSNILYANTFGANSLKLKDYPVSVDEVVGAAIENARIAADGKAAVLLDIGPLGELLEPMGSLSFEKAIELFAEVVRAGVKAHADGIVIETMADLYETKAAVLAARENSDLPVLVTMTFEKDGRTFAGTSLESMAATLEGLGVDAIGLNCSNGPDVLAGFLKKLAALTSLPIIAKPNAGLPDPKDGHYDMDAATFSDILASTLEDGVSIFGGCCGTTPEYISMVREKLQGKKKVQRIAEPYGVVCSSSSAIRLDQPRVIGERINPTGKKRFQKALLEKDLDYIVKVGLDQQEAGADILDVNVGFPGVDEKTMMPAVVKALQSVLDLPLQLDSSDVEALEAGLRVYNGKPSVNSVNGKKEVQEKLLPIVKKYGAAVVGLTMDENGIPDNTEKRVAIAENILQAAKKQGISSKDVWIDPLCLTVSAQQEQANETLQAIRIIHDRLGLQVVLGVSNISFGLPNRPLITMTFLLQALEEGLSLPIVNPNQKEIMDAIVAFKVLHGNDIGAENYIARFASDSTAPKTSGPASSSRKKGLQECIQKGLKAEAAEAAKELLDTKTELAIVEDDLIPALDVVGELYEKGTLFLPQLLSAAGAAQSVFEVLKTSLANKGEESLKKGPVILATVQGDIHDIGKNIVKTVMENYGFDIIDLGKDTPVQTVVDACKQHHCKLVGLSALMTTTLPSMEKTIQALKELDEAPLIMVGGAVVTPEWAKEAGADFYAKDARASAEIAKSVFESEE